MIDEKEILNELLSIEHFALTCEANAKALRQRATQLRKRLGAQAPAELSSGLTSQERADLVAGRLGRILRKQKASA